MRIHFGPRATFRAIVAASFYHDSYSPLKEIRGSFHFILGHTVVMTIRPKLIPIAILQSIRWDFIERFV